MIRYRKRPARNVANSTILTIRNVLIVDTMGNEEDLPTRAGLFAVSGVVTDWKQGKIAKILANFGKDAMMGKERRR